MESEDSNQRLAFDGVGLRAAVESVKEEIRELYLDDAVPWVIGYSGGKDSTAVLQLVWLALAELPAEQRTKPVHVISTDTLVENPIVASWVNRSLDVMQQAAGEQKMPIQPHRLTPAVGDSFWVNLIGRGYPAPRNKFRWCTLRLKITPSHTFIRDVVRENGEAILVLGTRRAESSARAHNMKTHAKRAIRDRLSPNSSLLNSLIYTPIEMWSNDEVWAFLTQVKNPWGYNNHDLMTMYRGASADGECPLVVDTSTPSCGNSRFGCYVCTLVDQDKSMAAMIQNDREKEWMEPLLALRNALDFRGEANRKKEWSRRDFRRIDGRLTLYTDTANVTKLIHGPYKQEVRAEWLRLLLETQLFVRENAPDELREWQLITLDELQEIRRIWVSEKHEIEDLLPGVYESVMGEPYPGTPVEDDLVFDRESLGLLREQCGENELHYEMVRNLLDVERKHRTKSTRRGLYDELATVITRCQYDNEEDALQWAMRKSGQRDGQIAESTEEDIADEQPEGVAESAPVELQVKVRKSKTPTLFETVGK